MGVNATVGRLFTSEEYRYGAPNLAVVSDAFWKRRFGGDPHAGGDQLRAYGRVFTVIGVLPPVFSFPDRTDIWLGATDEKNTSRTASNCRAIGRLRPGLRAAPAQAAPRP